MAGRLKSLTRRPAWKALGAHHKTMRDTHLRQLFADDPKRGERFTAEAVGLFLDYSKNRITDETLKLLLAVGGRVGPARAHRRHVPGEKINVSEKRAVLHVALRAPKGEKIVVDRQDVVPAVHAVLDKMSAFCDRVRSGEWKGHTGKRIRNVINIGIGGSDLGPVMAYEALRFYSQRDMTFRFVSNVDGTDFAEAVRDLDAAETLFIISSKTFTTLETMTNAHTARDWSLAGLGGDETASRQALRCGLDQCGGGQQVRHRYGQHVRVLGLGRRPLLDGLGDRPFDHDGHRPGELSRHAERLPPGGRALPHGALRAQPAGAPGTVGGLVQRLLRSADGGGVAVRAIPEALSGVSAAADHGEQRQACDARRQGSQLRYRTDLLGRTGHQWAALVLSVDSPGDKAYSVRFHRFLQNP